MLHDSLVLLKDLFGLWLILADGAVWTDVSRCRRLLTRLSRLEGELTGKAWL